MEIESLKSPQEFGIILSGRVLLLLGDSMKKLIAAIVVLSATALLIASSIQAKTTLVCQTGFHQNTRLQHL